MTRMVVTATALTFLAAGLSACAGQNDPGAWYVIYPSDSPAVLHYQTNPYAGGNAPPYFPGQVGGRS